jgi:GDP-mannose 6-dehydrogenase
MKLSIFGMGYVGTVSAACFADVGHEVIGIDTIPEKVNIINQGRSPVVEAGINVRIARAIRNGQLRATLDTEEAIAASDMSLVCVGTPGRPNGSLDLSHIKNVCQQLGRALKFRERYHLVVVRSTILPGTMAQTIVPTLEACSGKRAGHDFGVALNPEFLREGTSVQDFNHPPFTLIGTNDEEAAAALHPLYSHIDAPLITVGIEEAEMIKYASNSFHAVKVTFANEIGNICKGLGIDSHRVMEIFCRDTKLNISSHYLKPGSAFGGSCLPKDIRALLFRAKELDIDVPLLNSILVSNRMQSERAVDLVLGTGRRNIGVLGLSFKVGTDDLRESPMVSLIETLIGKGLKLSIYDREVQLARLFGANRAYIEREIPHIASLMRSTVTEVVDSSEVIVIGKKDDEFRQFVEAPQNGHMFIDLVRLFETGVERQDYQGICW